MPRISLSENLRSGLRTSLITPPKIPDTLNFSWAWMDETSIIKSAGNLTNWVNKGIAGAIGNLDTITGTIPIIQVGGKDVLSFNGTSFVRPSALRSLVQPSRIFVVYQLTDLTTQITCRVYDSYDSGTSRNHLGLDKTDNFHWLEAGVVLSTPNGSLTTNIEVSDSLFSGVNSSLEVSGLSKVIGSTGTQNWNYCTLGANFAGTANQMMLGTIHEFIVFNGVLPTAGQSEEIFNYLRFKWGSL